eukprot:11840842-Karenia_brevis.AAC.1
MAALQGKQIRSPGLLSHPLPTITWKDWQSGPCNDWFLSHTAFMCYVVKRGIKFPSGMQDSLSLRAIAVFA